MGLFKKKESSDSNLDVPPPPPMDDTQKGVPSGNIPPPDMPPPDMPAVDMPISGGLPPQDSPPMEQPDVHKDLKASTSDDVLNALPEPMESSPFDASSAKTPIEHPLETGFDLPPSDTQAFGETEKKTNR